MPTVALVGYTNAGKSTLFNALTGAEVLASERMFATLDPKLRQLTLPSRRKVLLSRHGGISAQSAACAGDAAFARRWKRWSARSCCCMCAMRPARRWTSRRRRWRRCWRSLEVAEQADAAGAEQDRSAAARDAVFAGRGTIAVSALTGEGLDDLLQAIDAALTADPLAEARVPDSAG